MKKIPAFNDADRWVVETALKEGYGRRPQVELADGEKDRQGVTSGKTGADLTRS